MKTIIKIDILSAAKIFGILNGGIYLIAGLVVNLAVLLFGIPALKELDLIGFGSGIMATFLVAMLIGSISFIIGAIFSWLYNQAAKMVGGITWEDVKADEHHHFFKTSAKKDNEKSAKEEIAEVNPQHEVNSILKKEKTDSRKDDKYSTNDPNFLSS